MLQPVESQSPAGRKDRSVSRSSNVRGETMEAFGRELDMLRQRVMTDLGERDAQYIHDILRLQRRCELVGRGLLFFGVLPPAWLAGVGFLSLSKVLENMEIGHNVLHGQYDWMNEPALMGAHYEWDWACPAADWRHSHNYIHHTFTNIVGRDRDIGYGLLRMAEEQPWHPIRLPQPVYAFLQMLTFEWAVAVHDLELDHVLTGRKSLQALRRAAEPVLRKTLSQLGKDYLWFPLLAGPGAPFVLTGNLTANLIRNVWAFLVIFCGHFPEGVEMFPEQALEGESRGAWYARQIRGSANVEGPRWFHILSGHLSHQIEHHLFPDMPAPRYAEVAAEVRALCRKHGVPYNSGTFGRQVRTAVARIARCALPPAALRGLRRRRA